MSRNQVIEVNGVLVTIHQQRGDDYISLTDLANAKEGDARASDVIKNWIRSRRTLEFIGTWEQLNTPDFKVVEFDQFKMQAGLTSFVLSPNEEFGNRTSQVTNTLELITLRLIDGRSDADKYQCFKQELATAKGWK